MKKLFQPIRQSGVAVLATAFYLLAVAAQAGNVAYWQFESGNPGADSSGNGHTLNLTSVTTAADLAADAPGAGSAVFDGTSSFAQTAAALDLSSVRTLTVEFFAKSTQTALGMICEHGPDVLNVPGAFYCDFNEGGDNLRVTEYSTGFNFEYGAAPVRDGNWHHYAATLNNDGSTVAFDLYVDGSLLTSVTRAQGAAAAGINDVFKLGARTGSLFFYNGSLDEVRISDRILDPASFLRNRYTNVTFGISQPPTNTVVAEGSPVTFTVAAAVTNAPAGVLEYQWLRDGTDLPGATTSSYTLAAASYASDNNAQFRVRITAAGILLANVLTSDLATLTVLPDTSAPVALATYAAAVNFVTVAFDTPLDPTTGGDYTLYSLNGGATVDSVQLISGNQVVVLNVTGLTAPTYTLSFTGIGDAYGNLATDSLVGTNTTGLTLADIGSVTLPGYVRATNSSSSLVAATGSDIWGGADGCAFLYTNLLGDFDLRVRLENITGGVNGNTRGGLMVREDTSAGSKNIAALTYANAGNWVVTARLATDGPTTIPGYPDAGLIARNSPYPNAWLRITRAGQTFNTYYSTNGLDWQALDGGGISPTEPFANALQVGMVSSQISVSGGGDSHALFTYSGFKNFVATEGTIVINTQPTNTTVLENRPVTFYVGATLQGGDPSGLHYQWRTNGVDVPGAASPTFTHATPSRTLSGTQVRCVVSAGPNIAPFASATAILTVTPDTVGPVPVSVAASALLPTSATVVFDELLDAATANEAWRYTLNGGYTVQTATLQADGKTVALTLDGLTSPQLHLTCTGVADLAGNPSTHGITATLNNAGLALADIQGGYPTMSSVLASTPAGFTLQSQFGDIWGAADSCSFVYQTMTNDFDVRVQIVSMTVAGGWARGGLMTRVSADADSANLLVGSYRDGFATHIWTERAAQGGATTFGTATQDPTFPNVWSRMQRVGSTFTAYHSADGYHWTQFGQITDLAAVEVMLVGMSFSTCVLDNPLTGTVQFDHFGPTVTIPQLQIAKSAGNVVLTWPASASGFQLQQAGELGAGASWSPVTNTVAQSGDQLQVTLPISGNSYYRLAH